MLGLAQLRTLLLSPAEFWRGRLQQERCGHAATLLVYVVVPWISIGSIAVLLRSIFEGAALTGFVLASAEFALQAGTWIILCVVLPTLTRQFDMELDEEQGFCLVSFASIPLWASGIFLLFGESSVLIFFWSRLVVLSAAAYSLLLIYNGLRVVFPESKKVPHLIGGLAFVAISTYALLFVCIGVASHIILIVLR